MSKEKQYTNTEDNNVRHTNTQLKEIFCGTNGYLSSKRVLGAIVLLACLIVVIVSTHKEGITDNIKDLIEVLIITATTLLGITSVANIFCKNKTNTNE